MNNQVIVQRQLDAKRGGLMKTLLINKIFLQFIIYCINNKVALHSLPQILQGRKRQIFKKKKKFNIGKRCNFENETLGNLNLKL